MSGSQVIGRRAGHNILPLCPGGTKIAPLLMGINYFLVKWDTGLAAETLYLVRIGRISKNCSVRIFHLIINVHFSLQL